MTSGSFDLYWRCLLDEDRELWVGLFTDPETMRHIGPPLSRQQAANGFDLALAAPDGGVHRVLFDSQGSACGIGLLAAPSPSAGSVEIGIILTATCRGHGLGRKGLALMIAEARARFGDAPVSVQYRPSHTATARMVTSLGFVDRGERTPAGLVRALLEGSAPVSSQTPCLES